MAFQKVGSRFKVGKGYLTGNIAYLLCRSNDFLFAAKKLTAIASGKLLELCLNDSRISVRTHIETDLAIFLEGLLCEYVKYCRGYSDKTLDDLYEYTKFWVKNFMTLRSK